MLGLHDRQKNIYNTRDITRGLENGKTISSQGKVGEFWTDWKREFYKVLEKSEFWLVFILYLLNSLNKILEMGKKQWESRGNLSVWKCGNHYKSAISNVQTPVGLIADWISLYASNPVAIAIFGIRQQNTNLYLPDWTTHSFKRKAFQYFSSKRVYFKQVVYSF